MDAILFPGDPSSAAGLCVESAEGVHLPLVASVYAIAWWCWRFVWDALFPLWTRGSPGEGYKFLVLCALSHRPAQAGAETVQSIRVDSHRPRSLLSAY